MPDEPQTLDPAAPTALVSSAAPVTTAPADTPVAAGSAVPDRAGPWAVRLVVVGLVLAAVNLRPAITSLGALLEEVRDGLHMSGTAAGVLTSVPPLCFAVFGITAPRLARRFGAAAVVCAGMAAIFAGLALRPFATGTVGFLAASALALMGIAVSNVLMPVIVKRYFPDRVGTVTGLYSMALALGTSLAAAATVPVTEALGGGWRTGLGVWAILAACAVLPWLPWHATAGPGRARAPPAGPPPTDRPPRRASPAAAPRGPSASSSVSRPPAPTSPWAGCRRSSGTPVSRPAPPECCSP